MNEIHILDNSTIDQISAGEVVERPASVVKELVENAIDAGASHITVEIRDGGIAMVRVTDDGSGIDRSQIERVFMRHATSKIASAEDLASVMSLGFRGEAMSSIAAVCQVELMTKTRDALTGSRAVINGGEMEGIEEAGLPDGTTIIARNIFFNTPVRRKFLKTPQTEGSYIADLMQHIALSKPDIAIQFIANGQTKFYTSGNGDLREIIYRIYGRDVASELIPLESEADGIQAHGFVGKPILNRSNRSYETFFVNGRYVRSAMIAGAVEEGYKTFLMQHKYPFVVLHFTIDPERIDVNVHPTKMDIRIHEPASVLSFIVGAVREAMSSSSLVQPMEAKPFVKESGQDKEERALTRTIPQPFEKNRMLVREASGYGEGSSGAETDQKSENGDAQKSTALSDNPLAQKILEGAKEAAQAAATPPMFLSGNVIKPKEMILVEKPEQMELFGEEEIKEQEIEQGRLIGQVFDTYWIFELTGKIYFIDQHAAHEKVMYERMMRRYRQKEPLSQQVSPPIAVSVTPKERETVLAHKEDFEAIGFQLEEFGEDAFALRSVPLDLYGCDGKELFTSILDELTAFPLKKDSETVLGKLASMACKAAVKGNTAISAREAGELIRELLSCENPYNCPHGRPTIVSMTRYEMEKKFKR